MCVHDLSGSVLVQFHCLGHTFSGHCLISLSEKTASSRHECMVQCYKKIEKVGKVSRNGSGRKKDEQSL